MFTDNKCYLIWHGFLRSYVSYDERFATDGVNSVRDSVTEQRTDMPAFVSYYALRIFPSNLNDQ